MVDEKDLATDQQTVPAGTKVRRTPEEKAARKARREADARQAEEAKKAEDFTHYVHLANGEVHRVTEENLPGHFGADPSAPYGHYITAGHVHVVTGVYPRETKEEVTK